MEIKEEEQKEGAVIKFTEVGKILADAGNVYQKNKDSHDKAIEYANKMIADNSAKLTAETYPSIKNLIAKFEVTRKTLLENRKPITQIIDALKKEFTKMEADLGKDSPTVVALQKMLDDFAAEQERLKKEAAEKLLKEQERLQQLSQVITDCNMYYNEKLYEQIANAKKLILDKFESCKTKSEIELIAKFLDEFAIIYNEFDNIKFSKTYTLLTSEEVQLKLKEIDFSVKLSEFRDKYVSELEIFIREQQDKIPSKLKAIADSEALAKRLQDEKDEAERKRLEDLKKQKDELEAKRIADEKAQQDAIAIQQSQTANIQEKVQAATQKVQAATAVQADLFSQISEVKTKKEYEISVTNNNGWVELFQYWFENSGKDLTNEKISKMTMDRMKEYAEKQAEKENSFIKSDNLLYNEKIKCK